jgi:predicted transcriptional regulator
MKKNQNEKIQRVDDSHEGKRKQALLRLSAARQSYNEDSSKLDDIKRETDEHKKQVTELSAKRSELLNAIDAELSRAADEYEHFQMAIGRYLQGMMEGLNASELFTKKIPLAD